MTTRSKSKIAVWLVAGAIAGAAAALGGYESLAAESFPDVPGEPTVMHTGFGIKSVFAVMRR